MVMKLYMLILMLAEHLNILKCDRSSFLLNLDAQSEYNSPECCPEGYSLASLNHEEDWLAATQLALKVLGPNKSVWIRQALNWTGFGGEQWTIITPKSSEQCPSFPPKDLKSFCIPVKHFRLSPNRIWQRKLPSICARTPKIDTNSRKIDYIE